MLEQRNAEYGGHDVEAAFAIAITRITVLHFVLRRVLGRLVLRGLIVVLVVFFADAASPGPPVPPSFLSLPQRPWTAPRLGLLAYEG